MNELINTKQQDSMTAWYAVLFVTGLCTLVCGQNYSRSVGNSIKEDLGTTDAQMGLLMGFAFAIFYTLAGTQLQNTRTLRAEK